MDHWELYKELTEGMGIAGYEGSIVEIMKRNFSNHAEILRDKLGSIIAKRPGSSERPRIMFAAHMDEIGFVVQEITKEGFIKFLPIGGWWPGNLPGLRVKVRNSKGELIPGVIGLKPIHELTPEEQKKMPELDHMYIDVGATQTFNPREKLGIKPGDPIFPDARLEKMANSDLLMAKAWDDRVGCALLIDLLNNMTAMEHPNTVYLAGTVQEEVGLRGAHTSAFGIDPDVGFALDVSICRDTPGNLGEPPEKLGAGVGILIYDRTMVPHARLREFVCELADLNSIPYHLTSIKGGYDTGAIHLTRCGVPSLAIGVPSRYIHSGSSIISMEDYDNVLKLLTLIVKNLNDETMEQVLK